MLFVVLIGLFTVLWNPATSERESTTVETTHGPVKGEELEYEGTPYTSFKGIPYAATPVGDLRFRAPAPPDSWTEVRNATKFGSNCLQPNQKIRSSEDCLTLNVYTPSLGSSLKAVLFWIHGGGFVTGSGTDIFYGPQYLLQQDIVVVTINYRLGALGFLATSSSDASGNWGLKDQVAAMKWVQDNIARFGGDPKQVTIYGESAGGMSISFHLLSPLSKGLFRSAISSSGTVSVDMMSSYYQQGKYSRNLAKILGASENEIEDPAKRIQFLRTVDASEITQRMREVFDEEEAASPLRDMLVPFLPVVENSDENGAFLTECPETLLAEGTFNKVPMIMGLNELDGGLIYFPGFEMNITAQGREETEEKVCQFLPVDLMEPVVARNECSLVAQKIRDTYFNGGPFSSSLLNFTYLVGDRVFASAIHHAQEMHAKYADKHSPLYNYYFTFEGKWNVLHYLLGVPVPGALHGDDVFYVFKPTILALPQLPTSSPTVVTKDRMISFITNFVKYGDPTPSVSDLVPIKWKPATKNTLYTMFIGTDLKLEKDYLKTRANLWSELRAKYIGRKWMSKSRSRGWRPSLDVLCCLMWLGIVVYLSFCGVLGSSSRLSKRCLGSCKAI